MKLYIVGSVASGKSTLARRLSAKTGIPCYALDSFVHKPDKAGAFGNTKRSETERDELFAEALQGDCILEDTGRACFAEGLRRADRIVVLDLPRRVRYRRILLRYIKQKLGIEPCGYTPSLKMVRCMFRWAKAFDTGADGVKQRAAPYADKTVVLRSLAEVRKFEEDFS